MALCRIDVQELAADRWVAEMEAGAYARRKRLVLRGRNFDEMMAAIVAAYGELTSVPEHVADAAKREAAPEQSAPVDDGAEASGPGRFERVTEEQMTEAASLGVAMDRRWSRARAQEAIDRKLAE